MSVTSTQRVRCFDFRNISVGSAPRDGVTGAGTKKQEESCNETELRLAIQSRTVLLPNIPLPSDANEEIIRTNRGRPYIFTH